MTKTAEMDVEPGLVSQRQLVLAKWKASQSLIDTEECSKMGGLC